MSSFMNFKTACPRVLLATLVTDEWLIARVYQLMSLKMTFRDKSFITLLKTALKRPFSGLNY